MKTNLNKKARVYSYSMALLLFTLGCGSGTESQENGESQITQSDFSSDAVAFEEYAPDTIGISDGFLDFESYKSQFDTVGIDGTVYYIVEGDLLLDDKELHQQFYRVNKPQDSQKLVGITRNGNILRIEDPTDIKYAIIKKSFSSSEYEKLVVYLKDATDDWSRVCNVAFNHVSRLDATLEVDDNPEEVTFIVRKMRTSKRGLLASAFFPYDPKPERRMLITPAFFQTSFEKTGILRHEIGHILGFRHEHIRSGAPAICPKNESVDHTIELTDYDPQSVMHYFCGDAGTRELKLTKIDSIGASLVYR
ncbi:matrixin family metalloprotease [Parapedobacter indicus]|uniref:Matrixin n=1 Tax=Parapedobacter indicus TaxID=1477437 RepID=A0A1I3CKD8_9SPHI|nr:matrixin family metalloprotease [Parapedobacter indicus]PPL04279.1 matrixin [Parapedobacter indicus]SFH74776.1 Matrixin [Parapedobacter indicus]